MFRLALMSLLPLFVGAAVFAQKKGSSAIARVGLEDPFTAKDAKVMQRLGVVAYGPLTWADDLRTTDIEKVLGEGRFLWMETEHFKIGSSLGFVGAPQDAKARRLLKGETRRLNKKCRKIKASQSKLGPWVRVHLYAQRAEDLHAEFCRLSGRSSLGKQKLLVLLFQKKSDLARYLNRFCGKSSQQSQRHAHSRTGHHAVVITAEGDDGPRDCATVHAQFRFLTVQMLVDAAGGAPYWLSYGLAHWFERQVPCNLINCGIRADESVDPSTQYEWREKMRKRARHEELCIPFVKLCRATDLGYYGHVQSWSRVDYLLQDRDRFGEFFAAVLGNGSRSRQIAALASAYELAPEEFDQAWRKWVMKTYK
ncbi:MAG TPA: hypothetical protein ENI87_04030 [bacterium]|nr:hypothetical protein [bacterium]